MEMCKIKNRGAGFVTYRIPEDGIRRSFSPGEVKTVSFEELEKLTFQPGGMTILTDFLQILDTPVIEKFNMSVEPEYHMTENDVAKLIISDSLDAFLDALDFAPTGVIDLIKKLSIEIPMTDFNKRKALKDKLGFDVDAALKHKEESEEDEQSTILKTSNERRVKKEEPVPQGRRTTPKYNVITTGDNTKK